MTAKPAHENKNASVLPLKQLLPMSAALILVAITGCMVFPFPASGKKILSGTQIQHDDLAFVRIGDTTREQIESRIGLPWTNYADLRVSVYCWEMVKGHWVWMLWLGYVGGGGD